MEGFQQATFLSIVYLSLIQICSCQVMHSYEKVK
jgi:hypothetical protein